jgi:glutathione peroxidase-family protein
MGRTEEQRIYDFSARVGTGAERRLADYRGKVLLVVNVASKCGFTPQYIGLQKLYEQFRSRGFEILGFPCDQFGHQEPGSDAEIATFCDRTYGITFPIFAKVAATLRRPRRRSEEQNEEQCGKRTLHRRPSFTIPFAPAQAGIRDVPR